MLIKGHTDEIDDQVKKTTKEMNEAKKKALLTEEEEEDDIYENFELGAFWLTWRQL